jgi:hypothetical protein
MFDEDWMMPGLKAIPHHQGDGLTRKVGHIYGRGREYPSRRCPMTLQQLGSIAPYAQTPFPGHRRAAWPPGAVKLSRILLIRRSGA